MTELLVGTKKGLFVLEGDAGSEKPFEVKARAFPGNVVEFAIRTRARAGTSHPSRPGTTARG